MEKLILRLMIVPEASLMKKALHFFLLILIGSLAACSNHYIGKHVPSLYSSRIESSSGSGTRKTKDVEIDFNYYIDSTSNTITLEGTVKILKAAGLGKRWKGNNFLEMDVFFLDSNNMIVSVNNFNLHIRRRPVTHSFPSWEDVLEPAHFKRTFPYEPIYAGIVFRCYAHLLFI